MLLVAIFVVGYLAIVLEHQLGLNKAATALLTGVLCWTAYIVPGEKGVITGELIHHLGDVSQVLFFLLGAMTIVELIDAHDGFDLITSRVTTANRRKLLASIAVLAFCLSSVLDNLTAAIVMMSLVRKLASESDDRMAYGGVVIIAANAGGVWSPIGDVTTTMLWVGGQVTSTSLVWRLILPAIVSALVPVIWIGLRMKGDVARPGNRAPSGGESQHEPRQGLDGEAPKATTALERRIVLIAGLGALLFVPVFKTLTHLPPFMGILLGLGLLWTLTELIHKRKYDEERSSLSVAAALQRVDSQSILFFLGILLAITALQSAGLLTSLARWMNSTIGNVDLITLSLGLSSSVVDNVPLVAAAQGMYSLSAFPTDHHFWLFLAYCAGTGGSILIIGSAPGIAVMGMERISFGWYLRRLSLPALFGYAAGALVYLGTTALSK